MKRGRLWFPLDVHFWDDPDVVAMGESAAILFQRMIAYAKVHATDGVLPMAAVRALGGRRWAAKMAAIVGQGVVAVTDVRAPDEHHFVANLAAIEGAVWCRVVAYLAWNDSSDRLEERREKTAEKKRRQRASIANVPQGQPGSVPVKAGGQEKEKRREETEESAYALSARAPEPPPDTLERSVMRSFAKRHESVTRTAFQEHAKVPWPKVLRWLAKTAELRGTTPAALAELVLEHWFSDPWVQEQKHPVAHFGKNYERYADAAPARASPQRGQAKPNDASVFKQQLAEGKAHDQNLL